MNTLLELHGLRKTFGSVTALAGVDLDLQAGEIHGLLGENGAGKSTLLRILAGVEAPGGGTIVLEGEPLAIAGPRAARALGIACVPQELELFPALSVCENLFGVAGLPHAAGWVRWRQAAVRARRALERLGASQPLARPAGSLSVRERALVQLAGALAGGARILAFDEPTASLGPEEAARFFAVLRDLRSRGAGILYVSHRLQEVLDLADRVTVLRDGRRVWTRPAPGLSEAEAIAAMVGRRLDVYFPSLAPPRDGILLAVEGLTDRGGRFDDVSFELRRGEILGIYGLFGSGASELARALSGLRPARGRLAGPYRKGPFRDPAAARAAGLAYLPADRLAEGNLPGRSVRENLTLSALARLGPPLWIDRRREEHLAASLRERLAVACPHLAAPVEALSGGNQQKVLLGRTLSTEPLVLVLEEPTRGIDVAARAEIHRWLAERAAAGQGVVLVSSDAPELIAMSHRVAVLREGRIAGELSGAGVREEDLARLALGSGGEGGGSAAPAGSGSWGAVSPAAPEASGPRRPRGSEPGRKGRWQLPVPATLGRRESVLVLATLALAGATQAAFPDFLSARSFAGLLAAAAPLAVAAAGMTAVIASGAIDLSAGSMLALAAAAWAFAVDGGGSIAAAATGAVLLGAGLGGINAALSLLLRVHPVVATLGTMGVYRGLFLLWTGGEWLDLPESARGLAHPGPLGVPLTAWAAGALLALLALLQRWRLEGREILALGGHPRAARTHGVRLVRARLAAFTVLGGAVGLAAVLHTARYGNLQNNTGSGFELQAIAAAVIGGAPIAGGRGAPGGAALGALFLALLSDVRAVWGIHERWQLVAVGLLMLAVIGAEGLLGRRSWRGP